MRENFSYVTQPLIKFKLMLFLIIGLVTINGYPVKAIGSEKRVVKTDDKVKIHCTVSLTDGTVFQSTRLGKPLKFTVGSEQMPLGLNRAVKGMKLNERKKVTVEAKDAYGKRDEGLVMKFVRSDLPENFVPVIGKTIKIQELGGTIVNVDEIHVFLDCNHPLAGKDVVFDIKVVGIE
ncbi:MAG: peptidylprolyl isomerase [Candidatus Scalindua sp.]